jgi:crotonobetainyl-CoA:carnitine CoA-transferase CaiB-like acyl-CoA transferase
MSFKTLFKGIKVVDISSVLAGPSVASFFAELGAEVIKIENPRSPDVTRTWKLSSEDEESNVSAYFSSVNFGKKYFQLNLKNEENKTEFLNLIKDASILISNFKKGDAEKFGIQDEKLFEINPGLIHGKISGFGEESDRVAYDLILQAESGFMSMNGTKESGPVKMPVALIDVLAAHQLKEAILLALLEKQQTQKGKAVHVSLYKAAICSLVNQATNYLMEGKIAERIGSLHPNIAPYGEIFSTNDKQQITFAIGSDLHFMKLSHFLGLEFLPDDPEFESNQLRVKNRKKLFQILQEIIEKFGSKEILEWSLQHHVPCGKIKKIDEVLNDKEAQEMMLFETIEGKETSRITSIAFN